MVHRWLLVCVSLIGFALVANSTQLTGAQEQIDESQWKRGFHGFNLICDAAGLNQVSQLEFEQLPPEDSVLVVFGDWNRVNFIAQFFDRGGAVLAASDQRGVYPAVLPGGIICKDNDSRVSRNIDAFSDMADCPVVRDLRQHPALEGVQAIATNRPGVLRAGRTKTFAFFPPLQNSRAPNPFIASSENRAGGRLLAVADQSVFTNQMITYEDNDLFAYQSMVWLKGEHRKHVLVMANGRELSPLDPSEVELAIPPPSREEVIDALSGLPPSAILEFANSVASVVEDQDLVNEFIHDNMDQVSQKVMNRFLIFLFFGLICLAFVAAFVGQKKLLRQTASVVATQRKNRELRNRKSHEEYERQWAAGVLLDSICIELADQRYNDWPSFPLGLDLDDGPDSKFIFNSMTKASNHFKSKPRSYWTRKRLLELEQDVLAWRAFFQRRGSNSQQDSIGVGVEAAEVNPPSFGGLDRDDLDRNT